MAKIYTSSVLKAGDNYKRFQNLLDRAKDRSTIMIKDGTFYFSNTLKVFNKTLYFQTEGNTRFTFPQGVNGIEFSRNRSVKTSVIEGLELRANDVKNGRGGHGFVMHTLFDLRHCMVQNFDGNGFHLTADVNNGTDISGSTLYRCESSENGGDGFYTQGGDANVVAFYSCDARDNGGYGFNDSSFLGCHYYTSMGHENKKGHFKTNPWTMLIGSYQEGGSRPSFAHPSTVIVGGIKGSDTGFYGSANIADDLKYVDYDGKDKWNLKQ